MFISLKRLHNQKGAHIIILGLIFPACLFVMAVLLDTALFYTSRAAMQNVVDAAAVAGAKALPGNYDTVKAAAEFYIPANDREGADRNYIPGATKTTEVSNDGKSFGTTGSKYCRVTLKAPANSIFMKKILPQSAIITVEAVAIKDNSNYAIFANDGVLPSKDTALYLEFKSFMGTSGKIVGDVHSNNDLYLSPPDSVITGNITAWNYSTDQIRSVPDKIPMPDISAKRTQAMKDGTYVNNISSVSLSADKGSSSKPMFYEDPGTDPNGMTVMLQPGTYYATFYSQNNSIKFTGNSFKLYGSLIAKSINFSASGSKGAFLMQAPSDTTKAQARLIR